MEMDEGHERGNGGYLEWAPFNRETWRDLNKSSL